MSDDLIKEKLFKLLSEREGIRNDVYLDSEGHPTVGYGHKVKPEDNLRVGDVVKNERIKQFYEQDSILAINAAREQALEIGTDDQDFLVNLSSVNFQLGTNWTHKFREETWPAITSGDYEGAANLLEKSLWNKQTPKRVKDFQQALRRLASAGPETPIPGRKPEMKPPVPGRKPEIAQPPIPERKPERLEKKIPIPERKPSFQRPIDLERTLIANMDDSVSTEKTISVEFDDGVVNIPAIHDGVELEDEEVIDLFLEGEIEHVGKYDNIEEAETAAVQRSEAIGEIREEEINEIREKIKLPETASLEVQSQISEADDEETYQDVNTDELPPYQKEVVESQDANMFGEIARLDSYAKELFGGEDPNNLEAIDKATFEFIDELSRKDISDYYDPDIPEDRDIDFNQYGVRNRPSPNRIPWIDQFAYANKKYSGQGIINNAIHEFLENPGFDSQPGYNVFSEPDIGNDPAFLDYVADVQSNPEYVYKRDLWNETKAEDFYYELGVHKGSASAVSMLTSFENALPLAFPFARTRDVSALMKNAVANTGLYGSLELLRGVYDPTVTAEEQIRNTVIATSIISPIATAMNPSRVGARPKVGSVPFELRNALSREFNAPYHGMAAGSEPNTFFNVIQKEAAEEELERLTRLAPTGMNIENLPLNANARLENSFFQAARGFVKDGPGSPKLTQGQAEGRLGNPISVNTKIINDYHSRLGSMLHLSRQQYMLYKVGAANESVSKNAFDVMMLDAKQAASSFIKGTEKPAMNFHEWNKQLSRALRDKDQHHIPEIQQVAQTWRKELDWINDQAMDVGLYKLPYLNRLESLNADLKAARALLPSDTGIDITKELGVGKKKEIVSGTMNKLEEKLRGLSAKQDELFEQGVDSADPRFTKIFTQIDETKAKLTKASERAGQVKKLDPEVKPALDEKQAKALRKQQRKVTNLERRIDATKKKIDELEANGPSLSGARSWFARYWRVDKITNDKARFVQELAQEIKKSSDGLSMRGAIAAATKATDEIIHGVDGISNLRGVDDIRPVSNAIERTLDIDDFNMIHWMEEDAESVLRSYVQGTATDIEFTRAFGDYSLKSVIKEINDEADIMLKKVKAQKDITDEIKYRRDRDLEDIRAVRDLMRGTYGISKDPYSLTSRGIRTLKQFNILVHMGGAAVSSLVDVARIPMTEGIADFFGIGLSALADDQAKIIRKLNRMEMHEAGEAWDMVTGWRALQFADVGDPFGKKMLWERQLADQSNMFFMLNGLNYWNSTIKEFTGLIVSNRIIKGSLQMAEGKASKKMIRKMKMSHIDEDMAKLIKKMYKKYGESTTLKNGRKFRVPNTGKWISEGGKEGAEAAAAFRAGLVDDVQRTIVTPAPGEKALWTSTEVGSLIAQFQSFAQASTSRVLIAGLQGRDAAFLHGVLGMVAMGMVVNEFKRVQNGVDTPQHVMEKVARGIDRSGLYGVFGPMAQLINVPTGNQMSLTNIVGKGAQKPDRDMWLSTFMGPSGTHVDTALGVGEAISKRDFGDAASNLKDSMPYGNMWFMPQQ